jgi:hypothetical protein
VTSFAALLAPSNMYTAPAVRTVSSINAAPFVAAQIDLVVEIARNDTLQDDRGQGDAQTPGTFLLVPENTGLRTNCSGVANALATAGTHRVRARIAGAYAHQVKFPIYAKIYHLSSLAAHG